MNSDNGLTERFEVTGGDFSKAGRISTKIKEILQEVGIDPAIVRRAAIAAYETEMNLVMYTQKGEIFLILNPDELKIRTVDQGPGIPDINLAMQEGYSTATEEMREMGFGAGMGLPNINKNADVFNITTELGKGSQFTIILYLNQKSKK